MSFYNICGFVNNIFNNKISIYLFIFPGITLLMIIKSLAPIKNSILGSTWLASSIAHPLMAYLYPRVEKISSN